MVGFSRFWCIFPFSLYFGRNISELHQRNNVIKISNNKKAQKFSRLKEGFWRRVWKHYRWKRGKALRIVLLVLCDNFHIFRQFLDCFSSFDAANTSRLLLPPLLLVLYVIFRLASLGICFVLENIVFDIFLTFLLGNTSFYQMKGFYYDYKLG